MSSEQIKTKPTPTVSSETVKRLLKDVRQIIKHPLVENGIYYCHDETDMLKGYAMIVGPSDTPYFGGYYFFKFTFPYDYPYSPPTVKFMSNNGTTRFNPNLYRNGKVCLSILNTWEGDKWSACQSIQTVLLALCTLLNEAPLLNEPGFTRNEPDFLKYQMSIEFVNIDYTIFDLLNLSLNNIPEPFEIFYPYMKEHFIKNYNKIREFIENKKDNNNNNGCIFVDVYKMTTCISYKKLYAKLEFTKTLFDELK